MTSRPGWWEWELQLSPHVLRRMLDRGFSEVDLRTMLEHATRVRAGEEPGRFVIETLHGSEPWEVIVEPDYAERLQVVVTAYPLDVA